MEHILDKQAITRLRISIPYLCGDGFQFEDLETPFLDCSEKLGYTKMKKALAADPTNSRARELAQVIQKWLFFGLLTKFFGMGDIDVRTEDFLDTDRRTITTEKLNPLLQQWAAKMPEFSEDERSLRALILKEYFRDAQVRLKGLSQCTVSPLAEVLLGVSLVGTVLVFAQRHVFRPGGTAPATGWSDTLAYRSWGKSKLLIDKMRSDGWCEYEIAQLYGGPFSTVGIAYAASLERPKRTKTHEKCSEKVCVAYDVDEATYETKHVADGCPCVRMEVRHTELCSMLQSGGVGVLKFEQDASGVPHFEAVAAATVEYVAISHVWADGLGNVEINSLPECQLKRVERLVRDMLAAPDTEPVYIWMDTLCVPTHPIAKACSTDVGGLNCRQLAIRRMRDTYDNATRTLVLDWELQQSPLPSTPEEALLRILVSGWMRRLWTFQEAWLSRNLHIQFQDRSVSIEDLIRRLDMSDHLPLWSEITEGFLSTQRDILEGRSTSQQLASLWNGFQGRTTTHMTDEPLVLGIMLGMDISEILKTEGVKRMFKLLSSIEEFPSDILFMPGPRMEEPGWGWAPTSFLGRQRWTKTTELGENPRERGLPAAAGRTVMNIGCKIARRSDFGLVFQAGGYVLHESEMPLCHFFYIAEKGVCSAMVVHIDEVDAPDWYDLGSSEGRDDLGIVLGGGRERGFDCLAALVSGCQRKGNKINAKFLCRIWLGFRTNHAPPSQNFEVDENSGRKYATVVHAAEVDDSQLWCVG